MDPKKGTIIFEFYNGDRWVPLTKQKDGFFAAKALKDSFGGVDKMKTCFNEKVLIVDLLH